MKIIEILSESAMLLGLKEEQVLLNEAQSEMLKQLSEQENSDSSIENKKQEIENSLLNNKNIKSLYNLIKYSLQELCTNYIPVVSNVKKQSVDKNIQIGEFENFIRVQNITKDNQNVKYKIINRAICFSSDGEYDIEYLTYPTITSLFDDVDFLSKFSNDVIVCSVCAYFSLANGMFDEFKDFHEMYIDKAENIKELKSFNLPQRRWE